MAYFGVILFGSSTSISSRRSFLFISIRTRSLVSKSGKGSLELSSFGKFCQMVVVVLILDPLAGDVGSDIEECSG